ncbi:MAG: hypothetical protein Q7S47_01600 [bacterium]|nr:hypothetical protein [bacterium]
MKKYLVSGVAAASAALLWGVMAASALTIQPVLIDDIHANPGDIVTRAVKLTNDSNVSVKLKEVVYDVVANENETGFPKVITKSDDSTLANWINAGVTSEITLQPRETVSVPIYVSIPKDAEPGGHYALVSWGAAEVEKPAGIGAGVSGEIALNLAIDVKGAVVEKGDLLSFATSDGKSKYDKLPVSFSVRVNNGGNRHFKPSGNVVITNMFGKAVATLPIVTGNSGGNVLPKSSRAYDVQWADGFAFGKYTATAAVSFGRAGSGTQSLEFWVLPAGLMILWLVIALVVLLILALLIKNIMMSMNKKA